MSLSMSVTIGLVAACSRCGAQTETLEAYAGYRFGARPNLARARSELLTLLRQRGWTRLTGQTLCPQCAAHGGDADG